MTTNEDSPLAFPRILIVVAWFGPLPPWFPLWLTSCRLNPDFDWLVATDADLPAASLPINVHVAELRMDEFAERIQEFAGVPVSFQRPYKACDYKPLYSCLLDLAPGSWDFWGHCDLDMLFGSLRTYVTPSLLARNDRVFGLGHFSLYRNDESTNNFFRLPHPELDYREILSDSAARGFDEHLGVNRVWRLHKGRFHEDEAVVADIDPQVRSLRRISTRGTSNSRRQAFGFDRGRVVRVYQRGRRLFAEEFMYMHFQKRAFTMPPVPDDCEAAWLTPDGFVPMDDRPQLELTSTP